MSQRFYPASARNWFSLDSVELQANGSSASYIGRQNIYAPVEYSYHCQSVSSFQDALLVINSSSPNNLNWRLNFVDFQVRPLRCVFKNVLSGESAAHWARFLFYATDSGLWFGQRNRFLLRQRLRRLLHPGDLDGPGDLAAAAVDICVRAAHDHALKHHGSVWWPQRPIDFCTTVRVKLSKARAPSLPPRRSWTQERFCMCLFLWRYFSSSFWCSLLPSMPFLNPSTVVSGILFPFEDQYVSLLHVSKCQIVASLCIDLECVCSMCVCHCGTDSEDTLNTLNQFF